MADISCNDKVAYVLSLMGCCNNRCRNCVCGDNRSKEPRTADSILEEARSVRDHFDGFILSDGEPTLLRDLPGILTGLAELDPEVLQVHTNGRMFAYSDYLDELLKVKGVDYLVNVYADTSAAHDAATSVKGSFEQTIRGLAGLSRAHRDGIGFHVSIPVTSETLRYLENTVEAVAALEPDSIVLTGGYPACGEPADFDFAAAQEKVQDLEGEYGADLIRSQFISGDIIPASYNHRVVSSPSGKFFVGADTNNPWVLRRAGKNPGRSLVAFMPYHLHIDKYMVVPAPCSSGILKGTAGLLGYPCDAVDLEARNQASGIDMGRHFPTREYFENGNCYAHLDDEEVMRQCLGDFERLLPPEELEGYDVIGVSMIDRISLSSGAAGIRYIKSKRGDAVLAAGVMQFDDVSYFKEHADYCFEVMNYGGFGFCGLLNMLEFGDRAPAALRNRLSYVAGSRKIEVNVDDPRNPAYDHCSIDLKLYFREPGEDLLEFAGERELNLDTGPTGVSMFYYSRGCKWKCVTCRMNELYAPKDPAMSARRIIDIHETSGLNVMFILDPALNNDEAGMKVFCDTLIKAKKDIIWSTSCRPRFRDPGILGLMRESGCVSLVFGVESGSRKIMSLLRKGYDPDVSARILHRAVEEGIWTQINLMSGFPTENEDDVRDTVRFLEDNADVIDSVSDHSSFLWRDDVRFTPDDFGMRFIPGSVYHICGNSRLYEESDGKSCEELHAEKLRAFASIERARSRWHVITSLVTPYDIYQLYRSGYDRKMVHRFVDYMKEKYRETLHEIVAGAQSVRWRDERMQVLTLNFDAEIPKVKIDL